MFDSFREQLTKIVGRTASKIDQKQTKIKDKTKALLKGQIIIEEKDLTETLNELELVLIRNDVALPVAKNITGKIKKKLVSKKIGIRENVEGVVYAVMKETLLETLSTPKKIILKSFIETCQKPVKIVFVGINGGGKTTSIAKIAHHLMKEGYSCVLAAGDTFRAAGIEQLEKHAERLNVPTIKHRRKADSAAVIYDAVQHAKAKNIDVVLADTAGRSHMNINLMDEMRKITRVNNPDLIIMVGDALTGHDAVEQARRFDDAVGIDGVILTKADADAKGGAALSITNSINKPILFLGTGQNYTDLEPFDPERFVQEILEQ